MSTSASLRNVDASKDNSDQESAIEPETRTSLSASFLTPRGVSRSGTQKDKRKSILSFTGSGRTVVPDEPKLFDPEKLSLEEYLRNYLQRQTQANVKGRELGVAFRDLRVTGFGSSNDVQPTLGSNFNPLTIPKGIKAARHPVTKDILSGFEGVVRPGEMLLVLGRPGSGCTSLLKTLSNHHSSFRSVEGTLNFSPFTSEEIHKHYRGDAVFVTEEDIHFATLTVGQTLDFAAKIRSPAQGAREPGTTRAGFVEMMSEILSSVFGLKHVRNTAVGDAAIRGVSGGEKKRVSIAEALAIRPKIGAWDNSTRGLDSSTALEFIRALRISTDTCKSSTIVSLYQASELLYDEFDKVCVVSEGRMVYFGPAREARQYFIDMGYEPANRQTTSDYLVSATDPHGRTVRSGYEARIPSTSEEMAAYFEKHELAKVNRDDVEGFLAEVNGPQKQGLVAAYKESVSAEHSKRARGGSPYLLTVPSQVREVFRRRFQIIRGDYKLQGLMIFTYLFQAIIMGTMFFKVPDSTSGYFSRGGVMFFALMFGGVSNLAEIPALYAQRPIVQKHMRAGMYHPFSEALALTLVDIPISFIAQLIFSVVLYFLVQLQQTPGQFFIFFLFVFTTNTALKAFMRMLTAAIASEAGAQAVAGLSFMTMIIYSGYAIPKPSMIGALRWLTWINPIQYAFEGILTNEFHSLDAPCSQLVPHGSGYENVTLANQVCTTVGSVSGRSTVSGDTFVELSFRYSHSHLWRNFGIICGFMIFFVSFLLIFTEISSSSAPDLLTTKYKSDPDDEEHENGATDAEKGHAQGIRRGGTNASEKLHGKVPEEAKMTDNFTWQNLRYIVPVGKGQTRQLLDDVSGYVVPGKLTALMGESGAGKTTLLNVLAQRTDVGVIAGDRFINGQAPPKDFQAQTGYCQQMDTHLGESTVREALTFSAVLRQPEDVPLSEKQAYVETCLKMCGMEEYADAIVGTLAVEQRKRTTIGVELAAKPRLLLFLDEPTSGLDSQSAWHIITCLRDLANHGQAILCTIHQPSSELFQVFDRLLLLRKGGQTVYFGNMGSHASTMIDYFERNGARPCGQTENPAEWMLDVIGAGATASSVIDWFSVWRQSKEYLIAQQEIEAIHEEGRTRPPVKTARHSKFATPWTFQVGQLVKRAFQSYWRNPEYVTGKLALNIMAALLNGFSFFKAKDTLQGTQNKIFAAFMSVMISFPLANQLQIPFIGFRDIFEIREQHSAMYHWTALIVSQVAVDLPFNIFSSSMFFVIWYWLVALPTSAAGYTYLVYGIIFPVYYQTMAQAVAALSPNAVTAGILFGTIQSFTFVFSGVLQPYRLLGWWKWMYRVSPLTYIIEGLIGNAVGHQLVNCSPVELVTLTPPSGQTCGAYMEQFISSSGGGYLTNPDASSGCQFCVARTTDEFIGSNFNISFNHRWRNVGIVCAMLLFNVFALFTITYLFRVRKRSIFALFSKN